MEREEQPRSRFLLMAVAFEGSLIAIAWLLGWLFGQPLVEQIRPEWSALGWGLAATAPLAAGLWLATRLPLGPLESLYTVVQRLIVPLFGGCTILDFALISLVAGVGEEMLFRGVIQQGLAQWSGSWWVGLMVASLLFGLVHMVTPTYAVLATLVGLYLGGLWIATDNLLAPIVTHAAYDLFALVYLVRWESRRVQG